jgi:hypothetical protein
MRRRHQAIPRLEPMEDRLVLSTTSTNPYSSAYTEITRLGNHIHQGWSSLERYISGLSQQGQPNSVAANRWATHAHRVRHSSGNLFGIPNFKL